MDKAATVANLSVEENGLIRGGASKPLHPVTYVLCLCTTSRFLHADLWFAQLAEELEQLVNLHAQGALTQEEFAAAKAKLLS